MTRENEKDKKIIRGTNKKETSIKKEYG